MITIVIPTYWTREQRQPPQPGDAIFDHPTPLDGESTLPRLLDSLSRLEPSPPFRVLVLTAPVAPELGPAAEARVQEILSPFAHHFPVGQFGPSHLPLLQQVIERAGFDAQSITLANYAGVRNLQLLLPHALASHIIIALDDDEIVAPDYLRVATQAITYPKVYGVAGFYEDPSGNTLLPEPPVSGNIFHDKPIIMNKAIQQLLAAPARLSPTALAFGGNMVFRRELFSQVGFDPAITRGEDLDYVLNAWMAGFTFWLDKMLRITHLPPRHYETHAYAKLVEDVRRFTYQREKVRHATQHGLSRPPPEIWMPYPGRFLQEDLEEHALKALAELATPEAMARWGSPEEVLAEAIQRAQERAPAYFEFAQRWPRLIQVVAEDAELQRSLSGLFMTST